MNQNRPDADASAAPTQGGRWRRVQDVMTPDVDVCEPDTELDYVARMMADRDCGAIPVVESTETMKPIGMVTDRDIVTRVIARQLDPHGRKASEAMSGNVLVVRQDMGLRECEKLMEQRRVRRAPVVDDKGRCIGMLSQADIARYAPGEETAELVREVSKGGEKKGT